MLGNARRTFEDSGRDDPLYAALTHHDRRGGLWSEDDFYATGRREIAAVLEAVDSRGSVPRGTALDFGCGPGRLSLALAGHFRQVTGVDISSTMLAAARAAAARDPDLSQRVGFLHNTEPDLRAVPSRSVDFVYSNITLQHVHPEATRAYIAEFVRILTEEGVAVFQLPDRAGPGKGAVGRWLYDLTHCTLRRAWKRVRGRIPYEIHGLRPHEVEAIVTEAGGRIDARTSDTGTGYVYEVRIVPGRRAP